MTALVAAASGWLRLPRVPWALPHLDPVRVRHVAAAGLVVAGTVVLIGPGWGLLVLAVLVEVVR